MSLSTVLHKIVVFLNAEGRIGIVEGRIGIVERCIGIVERCIGIAEGRIGIAKFNSLRINEMLY
ncbi:hypothetical protein [uncultured Nostoc sp.]|uniref:hypothetical protein n=1 Tax=uncultured Nostoc sp. TaxID=340711 RepID=UPI0026097CB8|nr:hypothetical protein [uncultured Nostoc sp.]